MKRTYMIAVKLKIEPVVYIEVIAESQADALSQVASDDLIQTHKDAFKEEALVEVDDAISSQLRIIACGRANQYHSEHDCELCSSLIGGDLK